LLFHRLRRINLRPRPARKSHLSLNPKVSQRGVRDDLIVCSMHPQNGRLFPQRDERALIEVLRGESVIHPSISWRDMRPVGRWGDSSWKMLWSHRRHEHRREQPFFLFGREDRCGAEVERLQDGAGRKAFMAPISRGQSPHILGRSRCPSSTAGKIGPGWHSLLVTCATQAKGRTGRLQGQGAYHLRVIDSVLDSYVASRDQPSRCKGGSSRRCTRAAR